MLNFLRAGDSPTRIIDLTLPMRPGMPVYPGDPSVSFTPVSAADPETEGFALTKVVLGTHTGTHLDAPAHAFPDAPGVDALSLAPCVGPAQVVDCTGLQQIGVPELRARLPRLARGARLLLRTDWDHCFGADRYYTDFPTLTLPAVRWLVERRIALLGLETPSVARGQDRACHARILEAGILLLEGLARLREIPCDTCWFVALPLPLEGLDGSPVRAMALVPK